MTGLGVDVHYTWLQVLNCWMIFLCFGYFLIRWGALLLSWVDFGKDSALHGSEHLALSIGLGTIALTWIATIFGHLGWLGVSSKWIWWAILVLPALITFFSRSSSSRTFSSFSHSLNRLSAWPLLDKVIFGTVILLFISRLLQATEIQPHGDPFNYHLLTARIWFDDGRIHFIEGLPFTIYSGLWDQLYLWSMELLGNKPGEGLIEAQLFSQWLHLFFGYGACGLVGYSVVQMLKNNSKTNRTWNLLTALAILSSASLRSFSFLAKNDWGAAFWCFISVSWILRGKQGWAAFFLGSAFAAKYTNAFAILGIVAFLWAPEFFTLSIKEAMKRLIPCGCLAFLGAAPILVRNYLYTQNPVFPALLSVFPTPVVPMDVLAYFSQFEGGKTPFHDVSFIQRMKQILLDSPFNFLVLVVLPFSLRLPALTEKIHKRFLLRLLGASLLSLVLFSMGTGAAAELRLGGCSNLLVILTSLWFASFWLTSPEFTSRSFGSISSWVVFLVLVSFSNLPVFMIPRVLHLSKKHLNLPQESLKLQTGNTTKAWLRLHAQDPNEQTQPRLLIAEDPQLYYLTAFKPIKLTDYPPYHNVLKDMKDPTEIFNFLHNTRIKYLYLNRNSREKELDSKRISYLHLLESYIHDHPSLVVSEDEHARVVDLQLQMSR